MESLLSLLGLPPDFFRNANIPIEKRKCHNRNANNYSSHKFDTFFYRIFLVTLEKLDVQEQYK